MTDYRSTMSRVRRAARPVLALAALWLVACTGGVQGTTVDSSGPAPGTPGSNTYTLGGTVSGLQGSGLVLQNNAGGNLSVAGNGSFTFSGAVLSGNSYSISVLTQPTNPLQTCVVTDGNGSVSAANITAVTVTCANKTASTDSIGGTVQGLTGTGLVLQDNGGDNLAIGANGVFTFATALVSGNPYTVTVLSPPQGPYENCAVSQGSGTTAAADVTNVLVTCQVNSNPTQTIGGTVSGLTGSGASITLQDNGRDSLTLSKDGSFTFPAPIPEGGAYSVTSAGSSGSKSITCTLGNANGTVPATPVTNITVTCQTNTTLAVTVTGLNGTGLVLQDNGGDNLTIAASGSYSFATQPVVGSPYNVTVLTQPQNLSQTCVVANGTGTAAPGLTVAVSCTTNSYSTSVNVTGLPVPLTGAPLKLTLNGAETLSITANGTFTFQTQILSGGSANIVITGEPGNDTSGGRGLQTDTPCWSGDHGGLQAPQTPVDNAANTLYFNCMSGPLGFIYVSNAGEQINVQPQNQLQNWFSIFSLLVDINGNVQVVDNPVTNMFPVGQPESNAVTALAADTSLMVNYPYLAAVANQPGNNAYLQTIGIDGNTGDAGGFYGTSILTLQGTLVTGTSAAAGATTPTSVTLGPGILDPNTGADAVTLYVTDSAGGVAEEFYTEAQAGAPGTTTLTPTYAGPIASGAGSSSSAFCQPGTAVEVDLALWITNRQANTLTQYVLDEYGNATAYQAPVATGTAPTSVVCYTQIVDEDVVQTTPYVANSGDGTISVIGLLPANGQLGVIQTVTVGAGGAGVGLVALMNDAQYPYLYALTTAGVWVYQIAGDGTLTLVSTTAYPAGAQPTAISTPLYYQLDTASAAGYFFVTNAGQHTLTEYSVGMTNGEPNGTLQIVNQSVAAGFSATSIQAVYRPNYNPG